MDQHAVAFAALSSPWPERPSVAMREMRKRGRRHAGRSGVVRRESGRVSSRTPPLGTIGAAPVWRRDRARRRRGRRGIELRPRKRAVTGAPDAVVAHPPGRPRRLVRLRVAGDGGAPAGEFVLTVGASDSNDRPCETGSRTGVASVASVRRPSTLTPRVLASRLLRPVRRPPLPGERRWGGVPIGVSLQWRRRWGAAAVGRSEFAMARNTEARPGVVSG
jgi:hypothetical protein